MAAHDAGTRTELDAIDPTPDVGHVLVDFAPTPGLRQVATSPADLARRSESAVDAAMGTIRSMARRVEAAVDALPHRPDQVEVEFGITLDAESGALIAKASAGASLTVRLTWSSDRP
ncbi:CU044_2847 family protein [Streptomyces sp. NPDC001820]|uniref:CU044_2847 family protein n=1 Tax=Streptomyces sp. NPDC001820 TaxID=3364613 RepID=UPI00369025A7